MTNYTNLCVSCSYFKVMLLGSNFLRYIHIFIQMYSYYPQAEMVPVPGKNLAANHSSGLPVQGFWKGHSSFELLRRIADMLRPSNCSINA